MSRFDLFFVVLDECNEQVDEHLARHIVAIHQLKDDAVQPEYSTEQLQRYIRFARLFQPVFTEEAKVDLVKKYQALRSDDAGGSVGRNSYRITVRQLESLIRLSEAVAKANCVDQVTPAFVEEAYKLLKQSIISVEKDDVEFEEDEDAAMADADTGAATAVDDQDGDSPMGGNDEAGEENGSVRASQTPARTPAPPRPRTQIKHEDYVKIQTKLLRRVYDDQNVAEDGTEEEDLLLWYLEEMEDELLTQEDVESQRSLAKKVLKKTVKDNILLPIRGEGLAEEGAEAERRGEKTMYVIQPNFPIEEFLGLAV
ncbi:MCM DNA helicase complex subunit mcm6 [Friedmanniomyces endolithicus]|nr:MCM DNA helicase complex subunit mcm6 [Friedmanniomyces endolithicus]KAK0792192.1 MCM DNA helicase complex subunit mcm6 [Friedmanniomyces endolithicus]